MESLICGKNNKIGKTPAVVMINPKYPHNVGAAVRAASNFGIKQILYTGNRVSMTPTKEYRLPREERMKGYKDVTLIQNDYPFDLFEKGVVPIAIEVRENTESLYSFEHPDNAIYVFGPEDGSIPQVMMRFCHRVVSIPTAHCLNLAAAVNVVLYDRGMKEYMNGKRPALPVALTLQEQRGWDNSNEKISDENSVDDLVY